MKHRIIVSLIIIVSIFGFILTASAAPITPTTGGGTGLASTSPSNQGYNLYASSVNASGVITFGFQANGSGGGGGLGTTTPFTAGNLTIVSSSGALSTYGGSSCPVGYVSVGQSASGTLSCSPASSTAVIWVDGNRTDSYTSNGSYLYPYKTMSAAVSAAAADSFTCNAFYLSPGTYVDGAPDTFPSCAFISGQQSTYVPVSGATFPGAFDIYDLTIAGNVTESDTSTASIHQLQNGSLTGNFSCAGNCLANNEAFPTTTSTITVQGGALSNFNGDFIESNIINVGTLNLNDDEVIGNATNTTGWMIYSSSTGSSVNINGATIIDLSPGTEGIYVNNGATSTPNNLNAFSLTVNTSTAGSTITAGSAATIITNVTSLTNQVGTFIAPSGTNFPPSYDETKSILGPLTVAQTGTFQGNISVSSTIMSPSSLILEPASGTTVNIQNFGSGFFAEFSTSLLGSNRIFSFPNLGGTFALGTGSAGNCASWSNANTLQSFGIGCGGGNVTVSPTSSVVAGEVPYYTTNGSSTINPTSTLTLSATGANVTGTVTVSNSLAVGTTSVACSGASGFCVSTTTAKSYVQAGTSTVSATIGGTIAYSATSTGNGAGASTSIETYSIPSSTYLTIGDEVDVFVGGTYANSAATNKQVQLAIASTTVFDTGSSFAPANTACNWFLESRGMANKTIPSGSPATTTILWITQYTDSCQNALTDDSGDAGNMTVTATTTSPINITVYGNGTNASDTIANYFRIQYNPF